MEVIKVENLCKKFKEKRKVFRALNNMYFEVKEGEILGFLGPNGAGKSTTIKILMNLIKADKGVAKIFDVDSQNPKSRMFVGFMPENPQYIDSLTGLELLYFSAKMHNITKNIKNIAYKLLEEFELIEAAKRPLRKYSKGMIQRIGFAAALIHNPKLLILDEPMSGLDPIGRVLFKKKMKELNKKGVTIFFSSHIIPDIEDICSKVIIVNQGKVIKELSRMDIKYFSTKGFQLICKGKLSNFEGYEVEKITENIYKLTIDKKIFVKDLEKLKEKNVDVIDIEPIKKDLEDIFIDILNKS